MKLIRNISNLEKNPQGCVATIGNFDGLHLGHQHLLKQLKQKSTELNLPALVITFDPLPAEYFLGEKSPARLFLLREKLALVQKFEIDQVLSLRFNQKLSQMSAEDFVKTVLHDLLNVKAIIVGDDFRFGYQRLGNFALLQKMGKQLNFTAIPTETFSISNERVGSSRVRNALAFGNFLLASQLLGRPYRMSGHVIYGDQRGRQLGFPTANISLHRLVSPLSGVFAVSVYGLSDKPLPGVANVGRRPTVDGKKQLLEIYLLDFNQNIYGKKIEVEFVEKIRDEEKFESLDALKKQIEKDVEISKKIFNVT
jgi:riboflavin kinase/FMN adenylyltransferase